MSDRIKMRATIPTFPGVTQVSPSDLTADDARVIAGATYTNPGVYGKWYPFSIYTTLEWWGNTTDANLCWLGYNFPSSQAVRRYKFKIQNQFYGAASWVLEYSDDNSNWYSADSKSGQSVVNNATYDSGLIAANGSHAYWRIRWTGMTLGNLSNLFVATVSFWV